MTAVFPTVPAHLKCTTLCSQGGGDNRNLASVQAAGLHLDTRLTFRKNIV